MPSRRKFHDLAMKIVKPGGEAHRRRQADHYGSDCAMAGHNIACALNKGQSEHPISLARMAYGV